MKISDAMIQLVVLSTLVLNSTHALAASKSKMEKCYGIAKAGMNDCQTATSKCASSSTKDGQRDAFIFLPKGICSRIVGGSLIDK